VKRRLGSSIVIPIETQSRNETISEMKKSEKREDVKRNQRLFGSLLIGTLDKFRKEEGTVAPTANAQVKKLSEIDKRLEKTKEEDRERIYVQKQELFAKRREEEIEFKKQRRQRAIEANAKEKEEHFRRLQNFIQTRAKPPVFYLPVKHTPETEALLAESSKSIELLIEKVREDRDRKLKGNAEEDDDEPNSGRLMSRVVTANEDNNEFAKDDSASNSDGAQGKN